MAITDDAPKLAPHTFAPWKAKGDARVVGSVAAWRKPAAWNRAAEAAADRPRVVVVADVSEDWAGEVVDATGDDLWWCEPCGTAATRPVILAAGSRASTVAGCPDCGADRRPYTVADARRRLFALVAATPHLDWQILPAPK